MRTFDWAATPLGPPSGWPQPLRTLVTVMLSAEQAMFLTWGPERTLLYNSAYGVILGRKHPAALGQPFMQVWQEAASELTPLFERVDAGEPVHMDDISLVLERHGRPEEAHFAFSYTPVRDDHRRVAGLFCPCSDTTAQVMSERRRAFRLKLADELRNLASPEDIMLAAEHALGSYLGATRVGYATPEQDGLHATLQTGFNAAGLAKLSGRYAFAALGRELAASQSQGRTSVLQDTALDPDAAAAWSSIGSRACVWVPLVRDGRLSTCLMVLSDAPRAWSQEDVSLIEDVAARSWETVERARAEANLRRLNETLEQRVAERTAERDRLWTNSRDLLVVLDRQGVFHAVNPAVHGVLGWTPEELVGRSFRDFVHPDDLPATEHALVQVTADRPEVFDNRWRHRDASYRWLSWTGRPDGEILYAIGRHITAEKEQQAALARAEETLRQSQKMEAVGQLTSGLAHDFNNLLTGISGGLEMLQSRLAAGRTDNLTRYIDIAQAGARRAASLTHRMLAFSRRLTLDPRPTNLDHLVAGMEELIRRTIGPEIALHVSPCRNLWATLIDPAQLDSALLNLCINARDAMPDGGTLMITTANHDLGAAQAARHEVSAGHYVSLCVTDTGGGMTAEVIRRAFDPFFTTKPIGTGTGLGLSMVYGFARQSGGYAHIDSAPGRGTTLCLYLPRHAASPEASAAEAAREPADGGGRAVLLVDDEPAVRQLAGEVLRERGYRVLEAEDGPSGLRLMQSGARVDLLVTDVGLPGGMNGRQLADAARAGRSDLPVLFITGYAETAVLGEGQLAPGMHLLTKPFALNVLAERVGELLKT